MANDWSLLDEGFVDRQSKSFVGRSIEQRPRLLEKFEFLLISYSTQKLNIWEFGLLGFFERILVAADYQKFELGVGLGKLKDFLNIFARLQSLNTKYVV